MLRSFRQVFKSNRTPMAAVMIVIWFAFERRRFEGPPTGEKILQRQAEIAAIEERLREQEAAASAQRAPAQ